MSVVPDVSGIDKVFDYAVPAKLRGRVTVGCRVRVPLNGRRVSGWVVAEGPSGQVESTRLVDIVSVSGPSVDPEVIPLTHWVARHWWGPWRAVLSSASAPRVRPRAVSARMARSAPARAPVDDVGAATLGLLESGGGVLVVPPLEPALNAISAAASRGPVLVVCPTVRMARLGAAALRKRGLATAEVPDQWEVAAAGADVVIGARSAVFAPCPSMSSIIVIDEHEDSLQEERTPTWDAAAVAMERARRRSSPLLLTTPAPSAWAQHRFAASTRHVRSDRGWPRVTVEDLQDLPIAGSLLGARLLTLVGEGRTVGCVLNTTGVARLLRCRSCSLLQVCDVCASALADEGDGVLACRRCLVPKGSVCGGCGRTDLRAIVGGLSLVARQLEASTGAVVAELTAASIDVPEAQVYVGTDAILHRLPRLDAVVFCDVDRDLLVARVSAGRDLVARVARSARVVGRGGELVLQSRLVKHPLLRALASEQVGESLEEWLEADLTMRRDLSLPPFSRLVMVAGDATPKETEFVALGIDWAVTEAGLMMRGSEDSLEAGIGLLRRDSQGGLRVHADPRRY